jgi:hypothetical protein
MIAHLLGQDDVSNDMARVGEGDCPGRLGEINALFVVQLGLSENSAIGIGYYQVLLHQGTDSQSNLLGNLLTKHRRGSLTLVNYTISVVE